MSDVLQQLDDSWLESDDEDYLGEEGMLADTAMDPLDQAQAVVEESEHSSMEPTGISDTIPTCSPVGTSATQPHHQPQPPTTLPTPALTNQSTPTHDNLTTLPLATSTPTSSPPSTPTHPVQTATPSAQPFQPIDFTEQVGPTNPLSSDATPLQYFAEVFGEQSFDKIAEQTNLYAQQNPPGESYNWIPTCTSEIMLFLGMLLTMGVHRLPDVRDYWSQNPLLGVPCIAKCMSVLRFKALMRCLHLNDNTTAVRPGESGFDKLHKIRPLLDTVKRNSLTKYKPHRENSVDEAMVLFKGKSSFKQYIPNKPTKRGYKVWVRADAINGYCCDIDIYAGATQGATQFGLGASVVKTMVEPLYGQGYFVFYDNFFSSIQLAKDLLEEKIYTIATTRVNRRNWPQCLRALKEMEKTMSRGDSRTELVEGQIECVVWKDNRCVPFINTISPPGQEETVLRRLKDGSRQSVKCPTTVKLYNQFMGGVDMADARRKSYSCSRRSRRWWLRLFYFLVDLSVTNSYILAQESPLFPKMGLKEYILSLAEELLAKHNSRKRPGRILLDAPPSARFCERHFPSKCETPRSCRYCSNSSTGPGRKRTCFTCEECDPQNPIHLCPYPCFKLYHTKEK